MNNTSAIKKNEKIHDIVTLANVLARARCMYGTHVLTEAIEYEAKIAKRKTLRKLNQRNY